MCANRSRPAHSSRRIRTPAEQPSKRHRMNRGGGSSGNQAQNLRHEFLRIDPEHLVGSGTDGVLYRLLKSGLRSLPMSREVKLVDFDSDLNRLDADMDAVLIERLNMYLKRRTQGSSDPHWANLIHKTLSQKTGFRFEEGDKRYYIFPSCIFVTDTTGTLDDTTASNASTLPAVDKVTDYHSKYKYQHSEDEANELLDERRKDRAKALQHTLDVTFLGFAIQVNDGQQDAAVDGRVKRAGGEAIDNSTYYRYIKLEQTQVHTTASQVVGDGQLDNTVTDLDARCGIIVTMLKGQLKKLFESRSTSSVRVDIGDARSSNSAHFHIQYNAEKHHTAYNEVTDNQLHHRKFYQTHGEDQKKHFNLDSLINRKVDGDDIKQYLTERGDLTREKRIVFRYFNERDREDQYIVYTFQVANAACKLAGDAIHLVTRSLEPGISAPDIKLYSLRDSACKYLMQASVDTASEAVRSETFNPDIVVPILSNPIEDSDYSSTEELTGADADADGGVNGGRPESSAGTDTAGSHEPEQDPIVVAYTRIAKASSVLKFVARLIMEVVRETDRRSSTTTTTAPKIGVDGVLRLRAPSASFTAGRSDHNEPFRMNSSYMLVHLLLCGSQHLRGVSYSRTETGKRTGSMFGTKARAQGMIYSVISGADAVRDAGSGLFHDQPAVVGADQSLSGRFLGVFCKNLSQGTSSSSSGFWSSSSSSSSSGATGGRSFGSNQSSMVTSNHILENIRLFYKEQLGSLAFHLHQRDDPEEFFLCLERRNFWPMYSKRIQMIHGPFYKDVVQADQHDHFLRHLFYYQLRTAMFPVAAAGAAMGPQTRSHLHTRGGGTGARGGGAAAADGSIADAVTGLDDKTDAGRLAMRIPTYYTDQPEFSALVSDAHRTLLNLRSLRYEPPANRSVYSINVLEQYGKHQKTAAAINLATSRDRTATDDMLESVKDGDSRALTDKLRGLMKSYGISDTMLIADLQRKNTRLLFHFLHMVENNGALDTLGNLHVTFRDVRDLKQVLEEALRIQRQESGGNIFARKTFFSATTLRGTPLEPIGKRLFSMEPFLTLRPELLRKMHRKNGLRHVLRDWSVHGNLFWNIMSFRESNSLFASRFASSPLSGFSLYVFLPSYIYLTREIRNIVPHLESSGRATLEAIVGTQEAMQDKSSSKLYDATGIDSIVRGLIFGVQQELLHTGETNLYIMHVKTKKTATSRRVVNPDTANTSTTAANGQYWLFGHWHRQYVLYELGSNIEMGDRGLKQLFPDQTVLAREKRMMNLLDDKVYESSEDMLAAVRRWRQEVESKTEQRTTMKRELGVRESSRRRRSSMRQKMDMYSAVNGTKSIAHLRAADSMSRSVLTKKEKVYDLVKIMQMLAFQPSVLPKLKKKDSTSGFGSGMDNQLFSSRPYQNNPMSATMWLVFRELYTFMPSMYNHIMMSMNDRLRYAELGLALNSGGLLAGGTLQPRKEPMALADNGFQYFVGTSAERKDRKDRRNFLLFMDDLHKDASHARIHRRHFFQMVLKNMAQLGAVQESSMSYHETEHAEVQVMPWLKYVAQEDIGKRVGQNKYLVVSALLNGVLATNAVMGSPVLRTAFRLVNPSGIVSTMASPLTLLAKSMLPVLWTPAILSFGAGATLGVSGTFSALAKTAGLLSSGYQEGSAGGNVVSGVTSAFQKALFGVAHGVQSGLKQSTSSVTNKVMDSLSHYMVTNVYMYRTTVRFVHNGSKYAWQFDMGVDRSTNRVLMYHGMQDSAQQVTAYRDIKYESDTDLQKIREHKRSQKQGRASGIRSSARSRHGSRSAASAVAPRRSSRPRPLSRKLGSRFQNMLTRRRF